MQDFTAGPTSRHLVKTMSFMLVTMVFQTLYFLIDLYWVGRLGKEAVAGVGIAGNLMFIVLAVTQMLGVGTTTLISHAAGRKDRDHALLVFNQSLALSIAVGALFFVICMAVRTTYVTALSPDPMTAKLAADYLSWFLPAMALQFGLVAMGAALRGVGNFKPGMIVSTATIIINIVLAPFLMFGWISNRPMGVAGAAIATFIAVAIGTVWLSFYFVRKHAYLRFVPAQWAPRFDLWGKLLGIGLPAGVEFALMAVYLFVVYTVIRPFGAAAQAGFGIGMRILQAGFMPVVALGFSVAPVAGQNFGARRPERVIEVFKTATMMAVGEMIVLAAVCQIAPDAMIRVFSSDAQVIAVGAEYLRITSLTFVASGIVFVTSSMFQAMGNTIPSLISSGVRIGLVAIPALALSRQAGFQLRWIWYLSMAAVVVQMTLNLLMLRREFNVRLNVEPAPAAQPAPSSI